MAAAAGSGGDVQDRIKESIAQDSADGNDSCYSFESLVFFSQLWMQLCAEPPSSEGGHGGVYDDQAARITTRVTRLRELSPADRDRQLRHPKGVWCCAIQVLATTMKIPYRVTSSAPKGDRPILEYTTKWSSPD